MPRFPSPLRVGAAAAALLLSACSDNPMAVSPEPVNVLAALRCSVDVRSETMTCVRTEPALGGINADKIIGGQGQFVQLTSSGTSYDSGAEILQSNVTVQNLVHAAIGTADGSTATGVQVFFHAGPTVTGGSGTAEVSNEDGEGSFTGSNQPFFDYEEILQPLQISSAKNWQFAVQSTVTSFTFEVYVNAKLVDEGPSMAMNIHKTWDGSTDAVWSTGTNWSGDAAPTTAQGVWIPGTGVAATQPLLDASTEILHLRLESTSTLGQGGFVLTVGGNLDAMGTISNGTTLMSGAGALMRGNVNALQVTGSTFLQGATKATGAVSVTGALATNGNALTISIP